MTERDPWEVDSSATPDPWEAPAADVSAVDPNYRPPQDRATLLQAGLQNLERVPAFIRGGVQGYQEGRPDRAANLAFQGLASPQSVQTTPQMMERFGASTERNIPLYNRLDTRTFGLPGQPQRVPEVTGLGSQAEGTAAAVDLFMPTGLEGGAKIAGKILGAFGKGTQNVSQGMIQSVVKPGKKLKEIPVPYRSENLFSPRPGYDAGVASKLGTKSTVDNLVDLHENLGKRSDEIFSQIPEVDLHKAIFEAEKQVEDAIKSGGSDLLGISGRDAGAMRAELSEWKKYVNDELFSKRGKVPGATAKQFRGSLGRAAKYDVENPTPKRVVAATIREELNNLVRSEKVSGKYATELKEIDRHFSETIPIRDALSASMGREGNKYGIGLRTAFGLMTGGPAGLLGIGAVEGTSRMAPLITAKRLGESAVRGGARLDRALTYPAVPITKQLLETEE